MINNKILKASGMTALERNNRNLEMSEDFNSVTASVESYAQKILFQAPKIFVSNRNTNISDIKWVMKAIRKARVKLIQFPILLERDFHHSNGEPVAP